MNKIDIRTIFTDHLSTLVDFRSGKKSSQDYVLFFLVPLFVSACLWFLGGIKVDVLNGILAAFSIFGGFLLNLLAVVYTVGQAVLSRSQVGDALLNVRRTFLKQVLANISFAIISSIVAVVICFAAILLLGSSTLGKNATYTHPFVTVLLGYVICNFLLTLLMIVGRVYQLLTFEFEQPLLKKVA